MKSADRGILSEHDLKKTSNKIVYGLMCVVILIMVFSMLYPICMTLFNGLKSNQEVNSFPPHFFPQEWHFSNLKEAMNYIDLLMFLKNTIYIFVGNMVVTLVVLGMSAFSISRMNVPYRKAIYFFFLMTLFIPATSYMIPNFVNLKELGLLNQYAAFWLPAGANTFYFLLLKNFFDGIHPEIFEAARIDGSSEPRSFSPLQCHCRFRYLLRWRSLSFLLHGMTGSGHLWLCTVKRNIRSRQQSINTLLM